MRERMILQMAMRGFACLAAALPLLACSCAGKTYEPVPDVTPDKPDVQEDTVAYHERAAELFDLINLHYRVKTGATAGFYNENYPKADGDNAASYLWPYDGLVSGAANLYALGHDVDYAGMLDRFEAYWRSSGVVDIGGYGSRTDGQYGYADRYYDDNSIVGLDLVEAYRLTGDSRYLDRAKRIVAFLKTGEDDIFGGGLWWDESLKNVAGDSNSNKPACSNGFAVKFLLQYWSVCPSEEKAEALAFAKRLYGWLCDNLRDPEDGLFWNDRPASGDINKTKWAYNTGAMISGGVMLYRITGQQSYLDQAMESAESSYNYFVRPDGGLALAYPDHDPWFTVKLIKAYVDIEPYYKNATGFIETFVKFADHAYENARTAEGFWYEDWTGEEEGRASQLLMQAAALEALGVIALWKGEAAER